MKNMNLSHYTKYEPFLQLVETNPKKNEDFFTFIKIIFSQQETYLQYYSSGEFIIKFVNLGNDKYFERVGQFKIQYGDNGSSFKTYQQNGKDKVENNLDCWL